MQCCLEWRDLDAVLQEQLLPLLPLSLRRPQRPQHRDQQAGNFFATFQDEPVLGCRVVDIGVSESETIRHGTIGFPKRVQILYCSSYAQLCIEDLIFHSLMMQLLHVIVKVVVLIIMDDFGPSRAQCQSSSCLATSSHRIDRFAPCLYVCRATGYHFFVDFA